MKLRDRQASYTMHRACKKMFIRMHQECHFSYPSPTHPRPPLCHVHVSKKQRKKYRQAQKLLPRGTNYIDPSPSQTISCHELAVSCLYWKGEKKMLRTLPVVNHQLTLEKRLEETTKFSTKGGSKAFKLDVR